MTDVRGSSAQVLNQIVPGHVRLVAHRDEARDADVEPLRVIEDRQAQRAALRGHRDGSSRRVDRRECRVQAHARGGVEQAHAVGPDEPAARLPNSVQQDRFARAPFGVAFAEPGADDADRRNVLADAVVDGREHVRRRDDHHGQIDGSGYVDHATVGGEPVDRPRPSGARARWSP